MDFIREEGDWKVKKDNLYYGDRLVIPEEEKDNVIRGYYEHQETTWGSYYMHERIERNILGLVDETLKNF